MPEGIIVDFWAFPEPTTALEVLAKALVELAVCTQASGELLGKGPPVLLVEGGIHLCGCEVDERRFLMLGFFSEAPLGLVRHCTLRVVEGMRNPAEAPSPAQGETGERGEPPQNPSNAPHL